MSVGTKEADDVRVTALKHAARTLEDTEPTDSTPTCKKELLNMEQRDLSGGSDKPPSRGVPTHLIDHHGATPADPPHLMLPVTSVTETSPKDVIFTCHMELFLPACVAKIKELITIGKDVTPAQCIEVEALISEFVDCFTISLRKVNLIPGTVHKLNIPKDATFRTKIPQCSFNPDQ